MAKIIKAAAKKGVKSLKKASKKMKKQAKKALKNKSTRSLYTEAEKKELQKLRNRRSYYKNSLKKLAADQAVDGITLTLKDIRGRISEDTAREMYYQGYFDSENADDYRNRDFREWMTDEGDNDLMSQAIEEYNTLDIDGIDSQPMDPKTKKKNERIKKYTDELKKINDDIQKITDKAEKRKLLRDAKNIAKKAVAGTGESLAEIIDNADTIKKVFTDPERAAIEKIKSEFAKEIIKSVTADIEDPEEKAQTKQAIYAGVMQGPMAAVRTVIKNDILSDIAKEYGDAAVPFASSLIDFSTGIITGKGGSVKGVMSGMFETFILSSETLNPELMQERSEELINLQQSTIGNEAAKGLARNVMVDIAKDVIMSGGNIAAALPKIFKDVLFDTGKAAIKYHKDNKAAEAEKAKIAAKFTGQTKNVSQKEIEDKFFAD